MVSSEGRTGGCIREFLEYYLLVILNEGASTKQKIRELISEKSSDNNKYRQGSTLLVADKEVDAVIKRLRQRTQIKTAAEEKTFEITAEGQKALEEFNQLKERTSASKEEATQKLMSLLDTSPPKKYVLDVGTGGGYPAFRLAEAGCKLLGIDSSDFDYSKDVIQKAKEKIDRSKGYDIEFMVADVRELKDFQNSFDYVVSNQAVHCMKDQEGSIEAIYYILKKGGKFVCSDISVGLLGFLHHGFHSFLAISKEEWLRILPKYGYINVKVHDIKDFCVAEGQKPFQ